MAGGKSTDEPKVKNYAIGQGGVNLVADPLQLADPEMTQAQNAELIYDEQRGGAGSLSKRGGLAALTSALSGTIYGGVSLPLKTTYTRYLYVALQEAAANTFSKFDGSSWTTTATPLKAANQDNIFGAITYHAGYRAISLGTKILYPGGDYVTSSGTPANNTAPPLTMFDGTAGFELAHVPIGVSSDGNHSFGITDMLAANGKVYISVWDPPISGSPDLRGRVLALDPTQGTITQVGNPFGSGTGQRDAGYPSCLAWHQGKLWVGQNGHTPGNAGAVSWIYPDLDDQAWTLDTEALLGWPVSMAVAFGNLYVGVRGFTGTASPAVYQRLSTTGAWSSVESSASSGITYYTNLIVYNSELYAVLYVDDVSDVCHVRKTADGASWSTDRDVDSLDSWVAANQPINAIEYGGDLFVSFKATAVGASDGFVMRRSGGTWTKTLAAANVSGQMMILLEKT